MTICKFLWTSPHRRCGFDRRPAAKLIGTDATASLTRVGWVFTLAITAYTLVRLSWTPVVRQPEPLLKV
jgi:hypothetical protein